MHKHVLHTKKTQKNTEDGSVWKCLSYKYESLSPE